MIDQVDDRLKNWAESLLQISTFSLEPPRDDRPDSGASFYLLDLVDSPPLRSAKRPPLQLSLRYLVTIWAEAPEEAHRLLGELVFAAMEHPEFEVELAPVPAATWAAFGVIPRPAVLLRVPCRQERPETPAPLVREAIEVQAVPVISLHGTVLGPGGVPLMMAAVELPSLQRYTETDAKGRFSFDGVSGEVYTKRLRVRARGRARDVELEELPSNQEPLIIHFDPLD